MDKELKFLAHLSASSNDFCKRKLYASGEKLRSEPWYPAAWYQASEMYFRVNSANLEWKHLVERVGNVKNMRLLRPDGNGVYF